MAYQKASKKQSKLQNPAALDERVEVKKTMGRVLPILFNTDMVLAILDGRKTVTRRVVRYKYSNTEMKMRTDKYGTRLIEIQKDIEGETHGRNPDGGTWHKLLPYIEKKPPYKPGDILYVRETWSEWTDGYVYKAWVQPFPQSGRYPDKFMKWHPSIHIPKEAARIWLRVTEVRVERLQDMTGQDILREGVNCHVHPEADYFDGNQKMMFAELWDSTIKKTDSDRYGWDVNPWVWVIEFERCEKPVREE